MVSLSTMAGPAMAWLAICIFGFANGMFLPAVSSLISFEAAADERGAIMGLFNASSSAGRIVGPALSGPIYFKFGPAAPFLLSAVLTVGGALLMVGALPHWTALAARPAARRGAAAWAAAGGLGGSYVTLGA